MSLSQNAILILNQIPTSTNEQISQKEEEMFREAFSKILESGESYTIDEIENWLNSKDGKHQIASERIINIAHYQKAKHDSKRRLKMISSDSCGCDC